MAVARYPVVLGWFPHLTRHFSLPTRSPRFSLCYSSTSALEGLPMSFSRRDFITTTALGTLGIAADAQQPPQESQRRKEMQASADPMLPPPKTPVILCKPTGNQSLEHAYKMLRDGEDTLEACIYVGQVQEDDPEDDSVGYGGLPNEEGVVELDSCCMHGPTRRAGSVASLRNTKHAARLGREVMDHTGHVMLVAEGAERFAFAM